MPQAETASDGVAAPGPISTPRAMTAVTTSGWKAGETTKSAPASSTRPAESTSSTVPIPTQASIAVFGFDGTQGRDRRLRIHHQLEDVDALVHQDVGHAQGDIGRESAAHAGDDTG